MSASGESKRLRLPGLSASSASNSEQNQILSNQNESADIVEVTNTCGLNISEIRNSASAIELDENINSETSTLAEESNVIDASKPYEYIPPCEDPYDKAWKYLSKHDILHLFQGITANVFHGKPKDPLEDMIKQIEKLQEEDRIRKGVIKRTPVNDT